MEGTHFILESRAGPARNQACLLSVGLWVKTNKQTNKCIVYIYRYNKQLMLILAHQLDVCCDCDG